jgi:uncharacterized Zn finger protein (UPF0148 family)
MNEERWECTECGACIVREQPPAVCPECGTGGAVFVEADDEPESQPEQQWLHEGLERGVFRSS